jgi:hypothetical protein
MRIMEPAMVALIQWAKPVLETGNGMGKGSR